jgi:transcriptional regulator with XRE-family HTH domain
VDVVRFGRVIRALRIRKGWRQLDLANLCGVSQSLIARVERAGAGRVRADTLARIATALDARLVLRIDWQGEAADRLLDADHAALVEHVVRLLRGAGWDVVPEATYALAGERGSIDILAWHSPTATVLIVEIKTVVPDVQGMIATYDRKVRHADAIARARGWRAARVASMLVITESRTSRRRVDAHAATFWRAVPERLEGRAPLHHKPSIPESAPRDLVPVT